MLALLLCLHGLARALPSPLPVPTPMDGREHEQYRSIRDASSAHHAATPRLQRIRSATSTGARSPESSGSRTSRPIRAPQTGASRRSRRLGKSTEEEAPSEAHLPPTHLNMYPWMQPNPYAWQDTTYANYAPVRGEEESDASTAFFNAQATSYGRRFESSSGTSVLPDTAHGAYEYEEGEVVRTMPTPTVSLEYKLQYNTDFPYESEDERVYQHRLGEDQKLICAEQVLQIRPASARQVQYLLTQQLIPHLAKDLLSDNVDRINAAVEELLPDGVPRIGSLYNRITWMTGWTNEQRRDVIRKLAEATQQSADELREFFLLENVGPEIAGEILAATTDTMLQNVARKYSLFAPTTGKALRWREGLSYIQRLALRQRMKAFGVPGKAEFYNLMQKKKVPRGYGRKMLKANDHEFGLIIAALNSKDPLPELTW
ncbi:hypothetical protein CBS101457_000127 [Exobasidium rhododendri]|nr:hypothetical protein CBS101457_000127 [Exobasidium rhododendri]